MGIIKKISLIALVGVFAPEVLAQDVVDNIGAASDVVSANANGLYDLLSYGAYIAGSWLSVASAMKLKENNDTGGRVPLNAALTRGVSGGLMLGLPSMFDTVAETLGASQSELISGSAGKIEQNATDIAGMAVAFSSNIPAMSHMLSILAMVIGAFFLIKSALMLSDLDMGKVTPQKVGWTGLAGAILWCLLPMIDMASGTIGANADATNILTQGLTGGGDDGKAQFDTVIKSCLMFGSFIGLVAFIRGVLLLKAVGDGSSGVMGRAMSHIFGGAAALNFPWTIKLLATSIGASSMICGTVSKVLCGL